jgi:hypothetical protein
MATALPYIPAGRISFRLLNDDVLAGVLLR